jgi:hypothetical protein
MSQQATFKSRKMAHVGVACALLMSTAAQAQNLSFAAGRDFPASGTDTSVNLVVGGDFRDNGKTDVVTVTTGALQGGSRVSILLGNGDGTLQAPSTITSSAQLINAIAVGDFNGDGKPDLVTVSTAAPPSISVFLGNGDGTFGAPVVTTLATPPQLTGALVVADFNVDGKSDVALTASAPQVNAGSVEVLISNGDGTFKAPVIYPIASISPLLAVGDLNGNGTPDLITGAVHKSPFFWGTATAHFKQP